MVTRGSHALGEGERVGRISAGEMAGVYVWVFPWWQASGSEPAAMAWELRLNTRSISLKLDEWERLFNSSGELDAYLGSLDVEWLQGDEAQRIRAEYFPVE